MASLHVLVVDDQPTNLKLVKVVLVAEGFVVQTAADAMEALRALDSFAPDVILTDLQMPGIDGLELTRRLKADVAHAHRPVVAVTAYAMKGDREQAIAAGCDEYLTKPLDIRELVRVVRRLTTAS